MDGSFLPCSVWALHRETRTGRESPEGAAGAGAGALLGLTLRAWHQQPPSHSRTLSISKVFLKNKIVLEKMIHGPTNMGKISHCLRPLKNPVVVPIGWFLSPRGPKPRPSPRSQA